MESRTSPGKRGSVQPLSESREGASSLSFLGYTHALTVGDDTLVAVSRVWPVLSSPACPKGPYPRRGFSFPGFLSLAERQGLCR